MGIVQIQAEFALTLTWLTFAWIVDIKTRLRMKESALVQIVVLGGTGIIVGTVKINI